MMCVYTVKSDSPLSYRGVLTPSLMFKACQLIKSTCSEWQPSILMDLETTWLLQLLSQLNIHLVCSIIFYNFLCKKI